MTLDAANAPIWEPSPEDIAAARVQAFMDWLNVRFDLSMASYSDLWSWSVADIDRFWLAIWDYFEVGKPLAPGSALADATMPGADWFAGQNTNFAEQVLNRAPPVGPAIIAFDETGLRHDLTRDDLCSTVLQCADALRRSGVQAGDRVVAVLPNEPTAMIAMLASASLGAIWSVVSPETGSDGVLARFGQLEPKVLIAAEGYRFGGGVIDRRQDLARVVEGLPTLTHVVVLPLSDSVATGAVAWSDFVSLGLPGQTTDDFDFARTPFGHPLWILFSSGTTGVPKAMVQSHGGILLEMLKNSALHLDLRSGDRMLFYTITGWMIWNLMFGALLAGAAVILYAGHPAKPDIGQLWRIAERGEATLFGASPAYVKSLMEADYRPGQHHDLRHLRSILLSGSPASAEAMRWLLDAVKRDLWIQSACGGTDVCTSFVGGVATLPVFAGEIQARGLGIDAQALDPDAKPLIDAVGELVVRQPMPSMPIAFWNDLGHQRYRETYFDLYPGIWRQGDFVQFNTRGGVHVLGRSDATLNRNGVRIGTSEIYLALEALPEIGDALIFDIEMPDGQAWMPLFVEVRAGFQFDVNLTDRIRSQLRTSLSPRHVPDDVVSVPAIPYTKTGKRLEVPVRRILAGAPFEDAVSQASVEDFAVLNTFIELARAAASRRPDRA